MVKCTAWGWPGRWAWWPERRWPALGSPVKKKRIWELKCSQVKYYRKEPRSRNNGVLSQACDVEIVQLGENMWLYDYQMSLWVSPPPKKNIYIYCLSHLHFICISSLHLLLLYHEHNLVLNLFIISRTLYNMILINNLLVANITVGTLGTDLTLSPTCQSSALGLDVQMFL